MQIFRRTTEGKHVELSCATGKSELSREFSVLISAGECEKREHFDTRKLFPSTNFPKAVKKKMYVAEHLFIIVLLAVLDY